MFKIVIVIVIKTLLCARLFIMVIIIIMIFNVKSVFSVNFCAFYFKNICKINVNKITNTHTLDTLFATFDNFVCMKSKHKRQFFFVCVFVVLTYNTIRVYVSIRIVNKQSKQRLLNNQ